MPPAGVEPARPYWTRDFESRVSAIFTTRASLPVFVRSRPRTRTWLCGAKIRHAATAPTGTNLRASPGSASDARESNAVFPDPKSGGLPSPSHPWGVADRWWGTESNRHSPEASELQSNGLATCPDPPRKELWAALNKESRPGRFPDGRLPGHDTFAVMAGSRYRCSATSSKVFAGQRLAAEQWMTATARRRTARRDSGGVTFASAWSFLPPGSTLLLFIMPGYSDTVNCIC